MKNDIDYRLRVMKLLYIHRKNENDKISLKTISNDSNIKYYIWLKYNEELEEYKTKRQSIDFKVNQGELEQCYQCEDRDKIKEIISRFTENTSLIYKYLNDNSDLISINSKLKEKK